MYNLTLLLPPLRPHLLPPTYPPTYLWGDSVHKLERTINILLQVSKTNFLSQNGSWPQASSTGSRYRSWCRYFFQDDISGKCSWRYELSSSIVVGCEGLLVSLGLPPAPSRVPLHTQFFTYGSLAFRTGLRGPCRVLWYQVPVALATDRCVPSSPCLPPPTSQAPWFGILLSAFSVWVS